MNTYLAAVDVDGAFDRAEHTLMFSQLEDAGLTTVEVQLLRKMYTNVQFIIAKNGAKPQKLERGIRQGCPGSPLAFIAIIGKVQRKLSELNLGVELVNGRKIPCIVYADDFLLLAATVEEMKIMIRVIEEELSTLGLFLSGKKTELQAFVRPPQQHHRNCQRRRGHGWTRSRRAIAVNAPRVDNNDISIPNTIINGESCSWSINSSFRYLGAQLGIGKNCSRISPAAAAFINLEESCFKNQQISAKTKIRVFMSIITPTLLYSIESSSLRASDQSKFNVFTQADYEELLMNLVALVV